MTGVFDLDRLLADSTWLRNLTRKLVGDDHASDLQQDVVLAALTQPAVIPTRTFASRSLPRWTRWARQPQPQPQPCRCCQSGARRGHSHFELRFFAAFPRRRFARRRAGWGAIELSRNHAANAASGSDPSASPSMNAAA